MLHCFRNSSAFTFFSFRVAGKGHVLELTASMSTLAGPEEYSDSVDVRLPQQYHISFIEPGQLDDNELARFSEFQVFSEHT
jgi:hypothetical protein